MRVLWWIFFVIAVCYEVWKVSIYTSTTYRWSQHYPTTWAVFSAALVLAALLYLYPLAKGYDETSKM